MLWSIPLPSMSQPNTLRARALWLADPERDRVSNCLDGAREPRLSRLTASPPALPRGHPSLRSTLDWNQSGRLSADGDDESQPSERSEKVQYRLLISW